MSPCLNNRQIDQTWRASPGTRGRRGKKTEKAGDGFVADAAGIEAAGIEAAETRPDSGEETGRNVEKTDRSGTGGEDSTRPGQGPML